MRIPTLVSLAIALSLALSSVAEETIQTETDKLTQADGTTEKVDPQTQTQTDDTTKPSTPAKACSPHPPRPKIETGSRFAGYFPTYNAKLGPVDKLNWKLYTDVMFFVAVPELNSTYSFVRMTNDEGEALATAFVKEAKKNKVVPILSVGGWTGSVNFSPLTADDDKREAFAKSLVTYAKRFGFLGLDGDWEYPNALGIGCNGLDPRDTINFGKLFKEIRKLWPEGILSAAIGISGLIGADGNPANTTETKLLVENLDYVNLMAYDFTGAWSTQTGPHAAISNKCSPNGPSVETGIASMISQGFQPSQITLGIPGYAHSFELNSTKLEKTVVGGETSLYYQNTTGRHIQGGKTDDPPQIDVCGNKTDWGGIFLVHELQEMKFISDDLQTGLNGFTRYFDKCSGTPFLTNGTLFFSYDDQVSTVAKAQLAKEKKLAGVYVFDTLGFRDDVNEATRKALSS